MPDSTAASVAGRLWPRWLRRGGILLVVAALGLGAGLVLDQRVSAQEAPDELVDRGREVYNAHCVRCHGDQARGRPDIGVPGLRDVGAATVDFYVRTGRMPMESIFSRIVHSEPELGADQRRVLIAYLTSLSPEQGPPIPDIQGWPQASLSRGLDLFNSNCAACHGPTGEGIALGQEDIASSLYQATPLEIAEAIRVGPGGMPVFGPDVYSQEDLEAVVKWVMDLREEGGGPGGITIGRSGPVSEGLVAWVIGMGVLGVAMYLLGEKAGDEPYDA